MKQFFARYALLITFSFIAFVYVSIRVAFIVHVVRNQNIVSLKEGDGCSKSHLEASSIYTDIGKRTSGESR